MNVLLTRCHRRARLAAELVEDAWLQDHRDAMQAYAAEEMICECLELDRLLRHGWEIVLDHLFDEVIDNIDSHYPVILAAVERTINTVKRVYRMARPAIDKGYAVERFTEFSAILPGLEELRLEIQRKWPTVNPQMIADSTAAYEAGDWKSAEDLLHDAKSQGAGTD